MENGKKEKKLFVIYPQKRAEEGRLDQVLRAALEGISAQVVDSMEELWENGGPRKWYGAVPGLPDTLCSAPGEKRGKPWIL